jgi:hypothetical protein
LVLAQNGIIFELFRSHAAAQPNFAAGIHADVSGHMGVIACVAPGFG